MGLRVREHDRWALLPRWHNMLQIPARGQGTTSIGVGKYLRRGDVGLEKTSMWPPSILRRSASIEAIASVAPLKHRRPPVSSTHLPPNCSSPLASSVHYLTSHDPRATDKTCHAITIPMFNMLSPLRMPLHSPNKRLALLTATTIRSG